MAKKATKTIGILALQGAFLEHQRTLEAMGQKVFLIRSLSEAKAREWDGLILPGGESTTMKKLLQKTGLDAWLLEQGKKGVAILGTCAGLIVLTDLGLLDVKVKRNAYGSQLDSFEDAIDWKDKSHRTKVTGIFIRAPQITQTGKTVEVLGRHQKTAVLVRQKNIWAASFHPELGGYTELYAEWLKI